MVALTSASNCKVLVTGANGFVAVWVVKSLLDKGYSVIGTVRSAEKGKYLQEKFKSFGDKFQLAIVKDITAEGTFDDLVKSVDAIEHTASPFHFNAEDPQEVIGPAVNGTLGILKSALKHGKSVKRVVITSSCGSILEHRSESTTFTENDWNNYDVNEVKTKGKNASAGAKYMASKTMAEKAAWDFVKEHQSEISWDLVCLNPSYIFGPVLHEVNKPSDLNTSSAMFYQNVTLPSSTSDLQELTASGGGYVDVRDVASAHVLALEVEDVGGERVILSTDTWCYQDFMDTANALSPQPLKSRDLPKGATGAGNSTKHMILYDNSKMRNLLGLNPHTREETTRAILEDYEARGW